MYTKFEDLLHKRGIKSYQVSKETGVSQVTLSQWKNGRSTPKVDKLKKIADYFGVTIDYFLQDNNNSSSDQ